MQTWDVKGKTILVTGATNGIGFEASVALARLGARVVMVGRDAARTAKAVADVKSRSGASDVGSLLCDFASQDSIRALAADFRREHDALHVLVNNAGTVFAERTVTADGLEATFAVNHLGYFLLTNLLLDLLVKSAPARIVSTASIGHRRATLDFDDLGFEKGGYFVMKSYARSKLGNVLMTRSLAKRLAGTGVTPTCLHPGGVATNIWSGAPKWSKPIIDYVFRWFFISAEEGGKTIVHLVTSPDGENHPGAYFEKNRPVRPSRLAEDDAVAERLWDVSARLVKLDGA